MAQWIKCGERLVNVDAVAAVFRHSDQTHVFLSGIGDNAHMHFAAEDGRKPWEWFVQQKPIDVLLDPPPLADPLLPKKRTSPQYSLSDIEATEHLPPARDRKATNPER